MSTPAVMGPASAPDLHVMSFNIRRAMDGPLVRRADRWGRRAPAVAALLGAEAPTILGLQEVRPRALRIVREALGPRYRSLGRGRGRHGDGEGTPILYDTSRVTLRSWTQQALSDTPSSPGSIGWGNLIPRILVAAEFTDVATGRSMLVVNTHLDHLSRTSRVHSARAVVALVARSAAPAVVMGDLNAGDRSSAVRALIAGGLADSWSEAETRLTPEWGTCPGYRPARAGGRRIDRILVTPGIRVREAAMNDRSFDGIRPSDHLPVQGLLTIVEDGR
ncbi:endonuclease/exonuclease/phosphatase family metal-dependent hydrolase [Microbacterium foliorum]|uniref:endonuclease/exonuclease/phosphatase family protein n=1 Tax=Microbacterium foliorum TaxID=104336 RepID=UPI00209F4BB4|nr:endonuclease/exonuclease/phosphatase family protein [Microbacterium foliorum]MCP1429858.1 endonuclease/exonuclease/phosphatase family metal-dependent hydrolase [Microbacterium foliorum]